MIPQNIVQAAVERGLDVIGITDHNSAENVAAVRMAADGAGICVIGGMEVTSAEEVHVLAFFDSDERLESFQQLVYRNLHGTNDPAVFGYQWVVDAEGGVIDVNPRLLIGATTLSVRDVVEEIHSHDGVAIAAHVDRQSFSIVSQLGFIPADLDLDAVELSPFHVQNGFGPEQLAAVSGRGRLPTTVTFSDAHYLEDVGRAYTKVTLEEWSVSDFGSALREDPRRLVAGGGGGGEA